MLLHVCQIACHCKVSFMLLALYRPMYRNNHENTINVPGKFKWAECSKEKKIRMLYVTLPVNLTLKII